MAEANQKLAEVFREMALALELTGADAFRVNAHNRAARICEEYPRDLMQIVLDEPEKAAAKLTGIEGIGKGTAKKIIEFANTGKVEEHDRLLAEVPPGLFDILRIPGLGPKTVRLMWDKLNITRMQDLEKAIADGSLLQLPRMGKKTVANIKDALDFMARSQGRIPAGIALPLAEQIAEILSKVKGVKRSQYAGSLRRGRDTVGDLDIIISADDPEEAGNTFINMPGVTKVLASGETKSSVRIAVPDNREMQADLRIVSDGVFEAALMYFTGSKEHNVMLRERAIKRNLRLNEYGLFPQPENQDLPPQQQGIKPIATTERDIYKALDLPFIPPELREEGVDYEAVDINSLIEETDLRAELHAHTTASDGKMSINELADLALAHGCHTIAVTDHSVSQPVANGLSPERLLEHIEKIREADARRDDINILAGSEVDILADGRLDYDDDILARLDIVIASPHNALSQDRETATRRLLKAIEHPLVHIIGHPTGRLIGRRPGLDPDMSQLFEAAAKHNTAMEINSHWMRLDLRDSHVRAAAAAGCLIAINTDTHKPSDMEMRKYGIATARRAALSKKQCLNTWSANKLKSWLNSVR